MVWLLQVLRRDIAKCHTRYEARKTDHRTSVLLLEARSAHCGSLSIVVSDVKQTSRDIYVFSNRFSSCSLSKDMTVQNFTLSDVRKTYHTKPTFFSKKHACFLRSNYMSGFLSGPKHAHRVKHEHGMHTTYIHSILTWSPHYTAYPRACSPRATASLARS